MRELQNTIERAVILTRDEIVEPGDLFLPHETGKLQAAAAAGAPVTTDPRNSADTIDKDLAYSPLNEFVDEMTKRHVLRALDQKHWKKQEAADMLGIDRATLYRMIKRFGLDSQTEG
ncbi:MAG: helix-turn-helix domain-containing protein [Sumerlaeia bacterium]